MLTEQYGKYLVHKIKIIVDTSITESRGLQSGTNADHVWFGAEVEWTF